MNIRRFRALHDAGASYAEIARECGCDWRTVRRYLAEEGLRCRHRVLDDTGAQLLFRFVAAAYERRALGIGSHWPVESWGRFLPEYTTAASMLDRLLHHCHVAVTDGESYRMREARNRGGGRPKKP